MTGPTPPPEALLTAALHLLAPRRRGVEELRGRLLRKGFEAREVANCLKWLEERDLLDDAAFSQALARDRLRFSPRSPSMVTRELARKGIPPAVAGGAVGAVLEEEGSSEGSLAEKAATDWVRKQGPGAVAAFLADRFSPERERARRRLHGFLTRRGFRGDSLKSGMEAGQAAARKRLSIKD